MPFYMAEKNKPRDFNNPTKEFYGNVTSMKK